MNGNFMDIATKLTDMFGYLGIFIICIPLPSEAVLPFVGLGIANGNYNAILAVLCTISSEVFSAICNYIIGYFGGEAILDKLERKTGKGRKAINKVGRLFDKYGKETVLMARIIPFTRTYVSLLAGVEKLNKFTYLIYSTIGVTILNLFLITLGYYIGNNQVLLGEVLKRYSIFVFISIITIIIISLINHNKKRKSQN